MTGFSLKRQVCGTQKKIAEDRKEWQKLKRAGRLAKIMAS